MKVLHTGDLHIGKSLCEFSMMEEQHYILQQIVSVAKSEEVDVVIIAGDVYDRSIPPTEAVEILEEFLQELISCGIKVFMTSGNHDSPERLSFGSRFMEGEGLYIEGTFHGEIRKVTIEDSYGPVHFYLLPYVKRGVIKHYLKQDISTMQEAVAELLKKTDVNEKERNVMITHYFVTNQGQAPLLSDSETIVNVGGIDNVEAGLFCAFSYTALGHIHGSQKIGEGEVYYSGSPLKYSFSEVHHKKGVNIVELKELGHVEVKRHLLNPQRDLRKIKGELQTLLKEEIYSQANTADYLYVELTNEEELFDPIGKLRSIYPNVCQLQFRKNNITKEQIQLATQNIRKKTTDSLFEEFYELVTQRQIDDDRKSMITDAIKKAERGDVS